jgi:hypothetical protein
VVITGIAAGGFLKIIWTSDCGLFCGGHSSSSSGKSSCRGGGPRTVANLLLDFVIVIIGILKKWTWDGGIGRRCFKGDNRGTGIRLVAMVTYTYMPLIGWWVTGRHRQGRQRY